MSRVDAKAVEDARRGSAFTAMSAPLVDQIMALALMTS